MRLEYKIPVIRGIRDMLADGDNVKPYLEWYLRGLEDSGVIRDYKFNDFKDGFLSIKMHEILTLELLDETRREKIEGTLQKSYRAELYQPSTIQPS